jgi:hypothetical protein
MSALHETRNVVANSAGTCPRNTILRMTPNPEFLCVLRTRYMKSPGP